MKKSPTRQGAVAHQNGGYRTAPAVELGFDHGSHGRTARVGLQVAHIRHEQNHFQQQIEVLLGFGGNRHHDRIAAPIFRQQAAVAELLLDPLRLRVALVDLVDGHDDGHLGGARVIDGFQRLRHHAVIGRHHQHHDIGDFGAAGAHAREGFVTGGIDEDDLAALHLHLVGADVLGDPTRLAAGHVGFPNGVQQRGLAVIDVAHDGHHGSAPQQVFGVFGFFHRLHGLFFIADGGGGGAELAGHFGGQFGIEGLVDGGENSAVHQFLHDQRGFHVQLFGKLLQGDAFADGDLAIDGRRTGFHLAALRPQDLLFFVALAGLRTGGPLIAGTPARRFHRRRRQAGLDAPARGGMLGPGSGGARHRRTRAHAGTRHHGLSGTNGSAINRLAGHRRTGSFRHSRARRRGLRRHGRAWSGQLRRQIGTRRHYRTRRGLSGERPGRSGGLPRRHRRAGTAHGRIGTRTFRAARNQRRPRHGGSGSAGRRPTAFRSGRHRLARSGENLSGSWRGSRGCGNGFRRGRRGPTRRNHGSRRHGGLRGRGRGRGGGRSGFRCRGRHGRRSGRLRRRCADVPSDGRMNRAACQGRTDRQRRGAVRFRRLGSLGLVGRLGSGRRRDGSSLGPGFGCRRMVRFRLFPAAFRSVLFVRDGAFRAAGLIAFHLRRIEAVEPPQLDRHVFVNGTGVRFLFCDAQFGQTIQNLVGLHFQLARQLVDANLLHR